MRQDRDGRDLDIILEQDGRNSGIGNSGRTAGYGGNSGREQARYAAGSRNSAGGNGRYAADVQLWRDDRRKGAAAVRSRSREAQMRYQREMRRKRRQRQRFLVCSLAAAVMLILIAAAGFGLWKIGTHLWEREEAQEALNDIKQQEEQKMISGNESEKPVMEEKFLTPNEYSRPGEPLPEVTELFVHYTANAGTSAAQNRSYFENLGITGETSASAHFVIGYNGEIIQCLPLNEIGYAVMEHNYNSVSIECCYLREDGKFEDATYESLIRLLGWLMKEYDLGSSAIKRHYDSNGKLCPKYYVEHEDEWKQLIRDVEAYVAEKPESNRFG